ncbi:MAG: ATP-dependent DNA helicase RecG [Chitinispirillaceae bacterium]|nr:ATP-dependent DNA helicase RecG [Chitinispirillaceae bacterium]
MTKTAGRTIDFLSPLSLIHGLGTKRAAALREAGIVTVGDLLYHFPRRYIDRSNVVPVGSVHSFLNDTCTVAGTIKKVHWERGRRSRLRALIADDSGSCELVWFAGIPVYRSLVKPGGRFLVTGRVTLYKHFQMVHPLIERVRAGNGTPPASFLPVYPVTEAMREAGINHRLLARSIAWVLDNCTRFPETVPARIEQKHSFPPLEQCLRRIHVPTEPQQLDRYRERLRYEELYRIALTLRWSSRKFALPGRSMVPGALSEQFRATLPFTLTGDQEKAVQVLYKDAASSRRMHRLLQGDVGSGKTIVAFFSCLPALASGLQIAWLSPTEILARQTHHTLNYWLDGLGWRASLLHGGMMSRDKKKVQDGLASGEVRFVVGTHALVQHTVTFKQLGMIVIDEQHKFGVEQRLALQEKDSASDFLLMSATPIPQTLAKTLYGDLEIVTIAGLPPGRKHVATHLVPGARRDALERFVREQIEQGNAAYWVVPRIGEDETVEPLRNIETTFRELTRGTFRNVPCGYLHGGMPCGDKERVMNSFAAGAIKLLVATTVVEVGMDVPQATCMVIENPERFGMAQLHQLRGRVGRSRMRSWCFLLVSPRADEKSVERLDNFCRHRDGFEIAEMDLALRGPGEVTGYQQTGWDDLKFADMVKDAPLFREIQDEIETLLPPCS